MADDKSMLGPWLDEGENLVFNPASKQIIGTLKPDGNVNTWPATNINGGSYGKPATIQKISPTHFVVLTPGFTKWEAIKALQEQYSEPAKVELVPSEAPAEVITQPESADNLSGFGTARKAKRE